LAFRVREDTSAAAVEALRLPLYAHTGQQRWAQKKRVRSRVSYGPSRYFEASSMMYPAPHLQAHYAWISYPAKPLAGALLPVRYSGCL